jgi:hypothetical protein
MDRSQVITFSDQLREARQNALRDAEAFDSIIQVVERFGSFLSHRISTLGGCKEHIEKVAICSALAEDIPRQWRDLHIPFSLLYDLFTDARNDALHQGAFARRLTRHAIELSLVLEDALRRSLDSPVVGDYMVRNPICAEEWQPISFIRQQMLVNSFSFLPLNTAQGWCLISDLEIATYLSTDHAKRKKRLAHSLKETGVSLQMAKFCSVDTSLEKALLMLDGDQRPLLVSLNAKDRQNVIGIVTPFDLL